MDAAATAQKRLDEIVRSPHVLSGMFQRFFHSEAAGSILLLIATVLGLVWANSPWAGAYLTLLHTEIAVHIGPYNLVLEIHKLVNDGLMVICFLVVGLELKRESAVGELSSARKALLPVAAAVGGMLLPALIYLVANCGKAGMDSWGIPMATDIAFALDIVVGSLICGVVGYALLRFWLPDEDVEAVKPEPVT
jgi:NhaA family Na+:H+ antiporter